MSAMSLRGAATVRLKRMAGPEATTRLRCLLRGFELPRWGNLRRTRPFSSTYGFERGTPIDRYYLHKFLNTHRDVITGRVLEVQTTSAADRYGHGVSCAHTFDIVPDFTPTYLCDFTAATIPVPPHSYDCLVLPNTLPHFRDLDGGLANALRVVRPGGAILASAAGLLPLTEDVADYWRLSPAGWRARLADAWPDADVTVEGYGNCLASVAAQFGLAHEELTAQELDVMDPRFPVLTTIVCRTR